MLPLRALVGAFGAGLSLAIAGSVALLIVSSVIAFNGWPDDLDGSGAATASTLAGAAGAAAPRAAAAVALPRSAAARAAVRPGAVDRRRSRSSAGTPRSTRPGATDSRAPVAPASAPPSSLSASSGGGSGHVEAKVDPVDSVGETLRGTTKAVAENVEPVASALESVGAAGGAAVAEVSGAVDDATAALLP